MSINEIEMDEAMPDVVAAVRAAAKAAVAPPPKVPAWKVLWRANVR